MKDPETNTERFHHYRDCGLDNVYISGGFSEIDTPYGKGVTIHDMDGLHRCIAQCLVKKPGLLTGREFRFLRTELDMSQATMGALCGRDERTVREWETRDAPVDDPANTIIRFIYEQGVNPSANYVELSKKLRFLAELDKELYEMKLQSTADGWKPANCQMRAA